MVPEVDIRTLGAYTCPVTHKKQEPPMPEWKRRATDVFRRGYHRESPFKANEKIRTNFQSVGMDSMAERVQDTIYGVFHELWPLCQVAHEKGDTEALRWTYDFEEWCSVTDVEGDVELGNAVGVSFYEHVISSPVVREQLPDWISRSRFEQLEGLFEAWLTAEEFEELKAAFQVRRSNLYWRETSKAQSLL